MDERQKHISILQKTAHVNTHLQVIMGLYRVWVTDTVEQINDAPNFSPWGCSYNDKITAHLNLDLGLWDI